LDPFWSIIFELFGFNFLLYFPLFSLFFEDFGTSDKRDKRRQERKRADQRREEETRGDKRTQEETRADKSRQEETRYKRGDK